MISHTHNVAFHDLYSQLVDESVRNSLELQKMEVRLFPIADVAKWVQFVEHLQLNNPQIPAPFRSVDILVKRYLKYFPPGNSTNSILDVGCETGKNARALALKHDVTLLDIAPNAIQYTINNLKRKHLAVRVVDAIVGKLENLDPKKGPFKAVVGTYAFSFIPPDIFNKVMKKNVLDRIEPRGYFAGGFFGPNHAWANDPNLTILSKKELTEFFTSRNFTILEIRETKEKIPTVLNGTQFFHTIEIIARKSFRNYPYILPGITFNPYSY